MLLKPQPAPILSVSLYAILSYTSVVSVHLQLFVRTICIFKVRRVYVSNELFEIPIDQFTFAQWPVAFFK